MQEPFLESVCRNMYTNILTALVPWSPVRLISGALVSPSGRQTPIDACRHARVRMTANRPPAPAHLLQRSATPPAPPSAMMKCQLVVLRMAWTFLCQLNSTTFAGKAGPVVTRLAGSFPAQHLHCRHETRMRSLSPAERSTDGCPRREFRHGRPHGTREAEARDRAVLCCVQKKQGASFTRDTMQCRGRCGRAGDTGMCTGTRA